MGAGVEELGTMNFDITPGSFTVILLIILTFNIFQLKSYVIIHAQ